MDTKICSISYQDNVSWLVLWLWSSGYVLLGDGIGSFEMLLINSVLSSFHPSSSFHRSQSLHPTKSMCHFFLLLFSLLLCVSFAIIIIINQHSHSLSYVYELMTLIWLTTDDECLLCYIASCYVVFPFFISYSLSLIDHTYVSLSFFMYIIFLYDLIFFPFHLLVMYVLYCVSFYSTLHHYIQFKQRNVQNQIEKIHVYINPSHHMSDSHWSRFFPTISCPRSLSLSLSLFVYPSNFHSLCDVHASICDPYDTCPPMCSFQTFCH